MTRKQFTETFEENKRDAQTGRGVAIIDTWSYDGCVVMGKYNCYPMKAWLESLTREEIERYGRGHAIAAAQEKMNARINGCHFGNPIYGATGSYTVR